MDKRQACFSSGDASKVRELDCMGREEHGGYMDLPYEIDKYVGPRGGEVDIMERLNYDSIVYQTVHSHYTYTWG